MKRNVGFAVLLLCFLCLGDTKPRSGVTSASSDVTITPMRNSKPLKLTINVVDQKYCTGDADLDGLRINVRLVYINTSNRPLILYKGSNLIARIMISNSLASIEAGRYKVDSSVTQITGGGKECFDGTVPPSRCFVILPPASSYEVQGTVGIFVTRDDGRKIVGAVGSGEHFVRVQVSTWPNSEALAEKLHRRWERNGMFVVWADNIRAAHVHSTKTAKGCGLPMITTAGMRLRGLWVLGTAEPRTVTNTQS